ncbi:MAG: hypothetical protein BGP17_01555 [Sphingomonas sp. 67-41]|nr:MAG: hypothetical protein BGP17_01555 [Sphingomonas sp. 67-41]
MPFETLPPPLRQSTRFLKRYILPSDNHGFVGRLYDLGIVTLSFDSYDELAKYPDCKYAVDVLDNVQLLARRVESLNLVGNMLWPDPLPTDFRTFPISQYDWLVVSADVFLTRYISVVDCALHLVNEVYEAGLVPPNCTLRHLAKAGIPADLVTILGEMLDDQGGLRDERNARIHQGEERAFTIDDRSFKTASLFNHRLNGMVGTDYYGRPINVQRSFKEGLVRLQRAFNRSTRKLVRQLDRVYDELWDEFEDRFGPRIAAATHGLNAGSRNKREA